MCKKKREIACPAHNSCTKVQMWRGIHSYSTGVILSFIKLQIPQEVEPNVTSATFLKKNYQKKWQTRENISRKLLFQVQEVIFTLKIDFMSIMKFISNSFGL